MTHPGTKLYRFSIHLSQQQFLRYYQGQAEKVQVTTECGKTLQLPAFRLRPFLSHSGILGRFELTVNNRNRIVSLVRISEK